MSVFASDALSGQVVLVTGASRGIGAAIATACSAAGADVAVGYLDNEEGARTTADTVASHGRRAETFKADVTDPDAVEEMIEQVISRFGHLNGLINNAGIMPETGVRDMSLDEWRRVLEVDLTGAFICSRAVIPTMIAQGSGSITMIASRLGQIGFAGLSHYASAKAGMLGLTKSMAKELGPLGIRVNAVAPGVTITDMAAEVMEGEVGQRRLAELPSGRFARADEVAASVVFLLSDAAALYYGQTLCPNGGGHMP